MKITITHDQNSIDPSAIYSDEQLLTVQSALEVEYQAELRKLFPNAEIKFSYGDSGGKDIAVTDTGFDNPYDIEYEVQRICESVFETGNFWV